MLEGTSPESGALAASGNELKRAMLTMRQSRAFLTARPGEKASASSSRAGGSGSAEGVSLTEDEIAGEGAGGPGKGRPVHLQKPFHGLIEPDEAALGMRHLTDIHNFNEMKAGRAKGSRKGKDKGKDKDGESG